MNKSKNPNYSDHAIYFWNQRDIYKVVKWFTETCQIIIVKVFIKTILCTCTHAHTPNCTHEHTDYTKLNLRNLKMGSKHCKCNWSDTWLSIPLLVIFMTYQTPLLKLQIHLSLSHDKLHYRNCKYTYLYHMSNSITEIANTPIFITWQTPLLILQIHLSITWQTPLLELQVHLSLSHVKLHYRNCKYTYLYHMTNSITEIANTPIFITCQTPLLKL